MASREWVIRGFDGGDVVMEEAPDGDRVRVRRELLPGGVEPGDRFGVVARVDRRRSPGVTVEPLSVATKVVDLGTA